MFLRNFDNSMLIQLGYGYVTTGNMNPGARYVLGNGFIDGNIAIKYTNGSTNGYTATNSSGYLNQLLALNPTDICLGDGNKPVTYEDYKLSGNVVINKLTKVELKDTYNTDTKEYVTTLIATYTNSTSDPITISEWGLYTNTSITSSSSNKQTFNNNNSSTVLNYREVLDEPVIIEAGTTATLTFELKISLFHQPA